MKADSSETVGLKTSDWKLSAASSY